MKNTVILMNNKEVSVEEILAKSREEAVCICHKCAIVFNERPFLCVCKSNVFLEDLINNKDK